MGISDRVRVLNVEVLSDNWYVLRKVTFEWRRKDGKWQKQSREAYDRGNGAAILLYNKAEGTIILTRQFRYPAYSNGHDDLLIEVPAGLLDEESPDVRIRAEAEEETGYKVHHVRKIFEAFMSPGSVTEILHFFVAEYDSSSKVGEGGGLADEGEDIEVLEVKFKDALQMIESGKIKDAKTIMLLQYAQIHLGLGEGVDNGRVHAP